MSASLKRIAKSNGTLVHAEEQSAPGLSPSKALVHVPPDVDLEAVEAAADGIPIATRGCSERAAGGTPQAGPAPLTRRGVPLAGSAASPLPVRQRRLVSLL